MRSLLPTTILLAACAGGTGTVDVTIWGEDGATLGFPNDELAIADDWTITFSHWITAFSDIELADGEERIVHADRTVFVAELTTAPDPAAVASFDLDVGRYKVSYSFVPVVAGATEVNEVDDALLAMMVERGWNTYVDGTATKGGETVTFRWGMANPARYQYCENGIDGGDGVAVVDGKAVEAGIFVHVDHLFWDRLGSEEAQLRFDAIAGWKDATNTVPFDDLADASIANLRDRDGDPILDEHGRPLRYDDAGLGFPKLREFIRFSTSQQAHLNGEGGCTRVGL